MKISSEVVEIYMDICRTSTLKCNSFAEIEYKIRKCATLGKIRYNQNGDYTVRYYDMDFTIRKNKIVGLKRDKNKNEVVVNEWDKIQYDRIHSKMVV